MSFIASLLGMNTRDIRELDNTQNLFWEIALPVTATIMLSAVAYVYYGSWGPWMRGKMGKMGD